MRNQRELAVTSLDEGAASFFYISIRMLSFYLQGCYHSICKDAIILFARMHENSMSLEKNMVY
jgi:hypothetical protein